MNTETIYPQLNIHLSRLKANAQKVSEACQQHGIQICGIVKGANGDPMVADALVQGGCHQIGDSRIHHLKALKEHGIASPLLLTRIPMLSEIEDLVQYVDISLNSELKVLQRIDEVAGRHGVRHKVILMCDLGDLREGYFDMKEAIEAALFVENHWLHVELYGIGTNLGCYGSVEPTVENLTQLIELTECIESKIGRTIEVISEGATSTLPLVFYDEVPERINHLRIGEGILLAKDLVAYWGLDLSYLNQDTFILEAELIEVKTKPTHPIGKLFVDAFGQRPHYEDRGIRKRGILAVGKQDFVHHDKLVPLDPNIAIVGSSSDHLIIDLEDASQSYRVGDVIAFTMYYVPMLYLSGSASIHKKYTE